MMDQLRVEDYQNLPSDKKLDLLLDQLDCCSRRNPIPMDNRESFAKLMSAKSELEFDEDFNKQAKEHLQGERIFINRMNILGYEPTIISALMIVLLLDEYTPGNIVIYATYCAYKCKKAGIKQMTSEHVLNWFGDGGFSIDDLRSFWDMQKSYGRSDNLVDHKDACSNIKY